MSKWLWATAAAAMLPLSGCGNAATETAADATGPANTYMASLRTRCGRAYLGEMIAGENEALAGKELVLAIAPCEVDDDVVITLHANTGPLQVSHKEEIWDRSRKFTIGQGGDQLKLTFGDHAEDGSAGPLDGIEALAADGGSDTRQTFSLGGADAPFVMETNAQSIAMQMPSTELAKGFHAEFGSSDRAAMPPPAWGAQ